MFNSFDDEEINIIDIVNNEFMLDVIDLDCKLEDKNLKDFYDMIGNIIKE